MHKKKKIPLPWAINDDAETEMLIREKKANLYWSVSRGWNVRSDSLTVGDALTALRGVLIDLDPSKKLHKLASDLQNNIVLHGSKSKLDKFNKRTDPAYVANSNKQAKMILL